MPPPARDDLAARISRAFTAGKLDLSTRPGAPNPGWPGMPEVRAAERLRSIGTSDVDLRTWLTLVAGLDRARDADRLWDCAASLVERAPWTIRPDDVVRRSVTELTDALRTAGVSQRHSQDTYIWRVVAESLARQASPTVHAALVDGTGSAPALLDAIATKTRDGTALFPYLSGPKVGPMWIRMLVVPGRARIERLDVLPVSVDVQVKKVGEHLGLTTTRGVDVEKCRAQIQDAWREQVESNGVAGPPELGSTCAALDPALWFFGKWGCTPCERAGRSLPIADVCAGCDGTFAAASSAKAKRSVEPA